MQKLVDGIHHFQCNVFLSQKALFEHLAQGQNPDTLFITCSDSRINPNLLTQTDPGDLFILRNAGNIIPPFGAAFGGEAATVEYAVAVLGVQNIIVCGHSLCGAMKGLLQPESVNGLTAVSSWLAHAETTRRIMKENYPHLESEKLLTATVEENVLVQLENLRTHPAVAVAISKGNLKLHGWVYKIETGEVFAYNPDTGQYQSLADAIVESAEIKPAESKRTRRPVKAIGP